MSTTARDIMNEDVVCAREGMTIRQLILLLKTNRITGVPVLDQAGGLVGVVSESDILLRDEAFGDTPALDSDFHSHPATEASTDLDGLDMDDFGAVSVREIMSTSPITAAADAPIAELAGMMFTNHIHRVVVVEGRTPVGIVSTMDILRAVMTGTVS